MTPGPGYEWQAYAPVQELDFDHLEEIDYWTPLPVPYLANTRNEKSKARHRAVRRGLKGLFR